MKKIFLSQQSKILILVCLSIFYNELLFRAVAKILLITPDILLVFVFCLFIGCCFTMFILLFPIRQQRKVTILVLLGLGILYASQMVYFGIFGTIYTFYSFLNGGKIWSFMDVILRELYKALIPILLLCLPLLIAKFWLQKRGTIQSKKLTKIVIIGIVGVLIFNVGIFFVANDKFGINSKFRLYYKDNNPLEATKKFGLFTAMRIDVQHFLGVIPKEPLNLSILKLSRNDQVKVPLVKATGFNQMELNLDDIIDHSDDSVHVEIAKFVKKQEATNKNRMTGKFKDFNLIYITAESLSKYSFHPQLTPTLWMMQEQGISFNHFYTPLWGVSTSDGEFTSLLSLFPKAGVWSMYQSHDNYLPFSYGNLFRRMGYVTQAFHNHDYTFYGRDLSHPNLGYDYFASGNGLEFTPGWPESDVELIEQTLDRFIHHDQFMTYYLTVSGHFPYDKSNKMVAKNYHLVSDLPYSEEVKAYFATQIELDKAMETLLKALREQGIADKTLIVINPDHYPYALSREAYEELANDSLSHPSDIYQSQVVFYHDGITPMKVDKLSSSIDLLPTLLNLFGIEYDARLFMGQDIFSQHEGIVLFVDRSWLSEKGYYDSQLNQFIPIQPLAFDQFYVESISESLRQKLQASVMILESDFFRALNLPY